MLDRNRYLLLSLLILLLAFGLRINAIADKAMWWDETWSVWASQHNFAQTTEITARDVHPPLYQWTLFAWIRLVGISEFSVRTLSALIGTMTVAVVIPLTRRLSGNNATALLAAFFVATSTFHIHWSQETRMYIMAAMFATMTVYAYLRINDKWSKWWLLLIISALGAALSQYLGGLMLIILCLHWLIFRRSYRRDFHLLWIRAMIVVGLLFSVWMIYAFGLIRSSEGTTDFSPIVVFELAATLLTVGKSTALSDYRLPMLLFAGIYGGGMVIFARRNREKATLIALVAILPPLAIYLLSLPFTPFYSPKPEERYFVIFAPVVYAGLGLALTQWWRINRLVGTFLIVIILIIFGKAYLDEAESRYFRDDYAMMMGAIDILAQEDDPVFFISGGRFPLVYYNLDRMTDGQSHLNINEIPA